MASKVAEFVNNWNETVKQHKISEKDVNNPSFDFLFDVLKSLLLELNVNVDLMKESLPENDAERMFYIRFCKYVDRLYQLSGKSARFYFMDLISPTPKKTIHVLKMLLNYLQFYKMAKADVIDAADKHLKEYDELLSRKNELETEVTKRETRAEKMKKEIQDYEEKLPEMKRRIEELTAREKEIDNECEAKMNDIKKADAELSTLEAREQELNQQMVDDNEYESCLSEIKAAENELVAVNQRIEHSKSSNVAECRAIDELEEYLKSIDAMIDRTEIAHVEQAVRLEEKLAELEQKVAGKQEQINTIADIEAEIVGEYKNLTEKLNRIRSDDRTLDASHKAMMVKLGKDIKKVNNELKLLRIQRGNAEENLCIEEEMRDYLRKIFHLVLSQICSPFGKR